MIVGMVGFISAGKDTAADYLVNVHQFRRESFASSLKDAISYIFGWDRVLLEGRTKEAREWREEIDPWWAERLSIPELTPRWIMQHWATEVCRNNFHDDIWIASLENKLRKTKDNVVISDVRFPNEIQAIKKAQGLVIRVARGPDPEWFQDAMDYNLGPKRIGWALSRNSLEKWGVHSSEYSWVGCDLDYTLTNNGTVDDLFQQLESVIKNHITVSV